MRIRPSSFPSAGPCHTVVKKGNRTFFCSSWVFALVSDCHDFDAPNFYGNYH